jgi:hypothetical protein
VSGADYLYKVAAPREDLTFRPRPFWRTADWSRSSDDEADLAGTEYVEDSVVYAGSFDEVNLHLLPNVWRLRVWLDDDLRSRRLRDLGYAWDDGARAVIFALDRDRGAIGSFSPTVYAFDRSGFELTPSGEYISREARVAVSVETLTFAEAKARWAFALVYVTDAEAFAESLRSAGIDHQIQT